MDPKKTLQFAKENLESSHLAEAIANIFDYLYWRIRGGFEPLGGDALSADLGAQILEAISELERKQYGPGV